MAPGLLIPKLALIHDMIANLFVPSLYLEVVIFLWDEL